MLKWCVNVAASGLVAWDEFRQALPFPISPGKLETAVLIEYRRKASKYRYSYSAVAPRLSIPCLNITPVFNVES